MIAALHGLRMRQPPAAKKSAANLPPRCGCSASCPIAAAWKGCKQQASGIDPKADRSSAWERAAARARKDFKESDRIRDELAAMGVVIKDGKDADGKPVTTWEIA